MKTIESQAELEKKIHAEVAGIGELTVAQGLALFVDFYRDVRAEGCLLEEDGDGLLYEWGTYDWGSGKWFNLGLARQFTREAIDEDGDSGTIMEQLRLEFSFSPSPELEEIESDNGWCFDPDDLDTFWEFIQESEPYQALSHLRAHHLEIVFHQV